MNLRSLISAISLIVPLTLEGGEGTVACLDCTVSNAVSTAPQNLGSLSWLEAFDFSTEQLESDYRRTIDGGPEAEAGNLSAHEWPRNPIAADAIMPIVFLAAAEVDEGQAADDQEGEVLPELNALLEVEIQNLELENAALRQRLAQLENAALRGRLADLEPAIEPIEPFVDPDWPTLEVKPKRRIRIRPRRPRPTHFESANRSPVVAVSREPVPFRPFTRAAMDTPRSGWISSERAQSLTEQSRFFRNASKALGDGVRSSEYRGIRLEVEKAMRRGDLNARYAVQYLADIVDVFRTYERLERFGLIGRVAPPVRGESLRKDPDLMFRWASEVNEQKRKMRY